MTKSKLLFQTLTESPLAKKSAETIDSISFLMYDEQKCSFCREPVLPLRHLFLIKSTTSIIETSVLESIMLLPLCVGNGCVSHHLFESLSYDDKLYFCGAGDSCIREIDFKSALHIIFKLFGTNYRGYKPIRYGTSSEFITGSTNINGYIIPTKQPGGHIHRPKNVVPLLPAVTKKFKLYSELQAKGE